MNDGTDFRKNVLKGNSKKKLPSATSCGMVFRFKLQASIFKLQALGAPGPQSSGIFSEARQLLVGCDIVYINPVPRYSCLI
jgi:hypothetical protein